MQFGPFLLSGALMSFFDDLSDKVSETIDSVKQKFSSEKLFNFAADVATKKMGTSNWDGLSPYLIAQFFEVAPVDNNGRRTWKRKIGSKVVKAPFVGDGTLSVQLAWQSPFENMSSENAAPNAAALLQSGQLNSILNAFTPDAFDTLKNKSQEYLSQYEGRTGLTKLNSIQTFNGMQPLDISGTLLFRAWNDGLTEVETPLNQFIEWALPVELSADSALVSAAKTVTQDKDASEDDKVDAHVQALMPSRSPVKIGMTFMGKTYLPLVIESFDFPITSPINPNGHHVCVALNVKLCSLTAIDRNDWRNL